MAYSSILKKHLNEHNRMAPGTFKRIPLSLRLRQVWKGVGFMAPILPICTLILALFLPGPTIGATLAISGFMLLVWGIVAWAIYHFGWREFQPTYEVHGVTVRFSAEEYYVPKDLMEIFISEILEKWKKVADNPEELLRNVTLVLQNEKPRDPRDGKEVIGLTHANVKRISFVWGPHVLNHSGAGYELRLQMCAALHGPRPEQEDLDWMVMKDLI